MDPRHSIIKLVVPGPAGEMETLSIHQGVLCKSSEFFKRMMKPEWVGLRDCPNTISLPDETADTVSDYVKWLYDGIVPWMLYKADKDGIREKVAQEAEKVFVLLAKAYVFGEKILDARYKNTVVRTVVAAKESSQWNMGPESVDIVYSGTPSGSLLRRLIAESFACLAHDDTEKGIGWMTFIDGYPKEALVDVIKATVKLRCKVENDVQQSTRSLDSYLEEEQ